ncbi:serine--tRNA ligase [Cohnella rhizosphaerae]|uniref:Serine--tRNA ligase n=1 Tax=Cohnella rhizosphaerae TaxID=1457232 RepID=A0A9X4KS38_9BACL|nr:serine--tRNA ligase [Cohnella rhizosphaerae]MDG0809528.1 serine--tRNA ligase [Cohnella rhizosphaerae]
MLYMTYIREHAELLQHSADRKGIAVSIRELLKLDASRRSLLQEVEGLRAERNRQSEAIAALVKSQRAPSGATVRNAGERDAKLGDVALPGEAPGAVAYEALVGEAKGKVREANAKLAALEARLTEVSAAWRSLLELVPNPVSADTPDGRSDADNVELRRVGEIPAFAFEPLDHVRLGERLGLLDLGRGVKLGGTRSYVLKGIGSRLHRAVQQLALDVLERRGFTQLELPAMMRGETFANTGFFPTGKDQTYALAEGDKYLIGTSEVGLVSYYAGETVALEEPIRLAAATPCFRSEVGSAGRDVHGLYRVHQFAKVEQVALCRGEASDAMLEEITANAEEILRLLELPYRVVAVCIGDMSQKSHKQYDIETWMPSRGAYGETHSSSNVLDFQARRAGIRYRDADGTLRYAHTLNNTAVATPRILIPLLENHQREDGSVCVPAALRPYLGGVAEIRTDA